MYSSIFSPRPPTLPNQFTEINLSFALLTLNQLFANAGDVEAADLGDYNAKFGNAVPPNPQGVWY